MPSAPAPLGDDLLQRLLTVFGETAASQDFTQRVTYTYLIGVYLAVNALQDAYLLVEGPDCAYMKSQYIQGNHDWLSTLTSVSGFHRLANTALHPAQMTDSREGPLRAMMQQLAVHPEAGALLVTSMPMAFVTGADYERLGRDVAVQCGKPVIHIPGLSLSGDWLDGYSETLKALAAQLDLGTPRPEPRKVAIVGYLFDRNEADHEANVAELRQLCTALDLDLTSVWLAGQRCADLTAVAQAGTILSLPYGRKAARLLCRRTGARLIELPLPFGLSATEHWLDTLGQAFNCKAAAENYRNRQLQRLVPRLEFVIPFVFQGLHVGYVGDPHLLAGLTDILDLLGADLSFAIVTNRQAHVREAATPAPTCSMLAWPKHKRFLHFLLKHIHERKVGLLVANNAGTIVPLPDTAIVEFGFPSIFSHALFDRPFFGFSGMLAFVDTLANALRQAELDRSRWRFVTTGSFHR